MLRLSPTSSARAYFNSRPSARGDGLRNQQRHVSPISIHAPPRGATDAHGTPITPTANFNSRPSARGDHLYNITLLHPCHFNSRPSARGDSNARIYAARNLGFQFTPLREGRPRWTRRFLPKAGNFNSRPSARGDGNSASTGSFGRVFQFTPLREGRRWRSADLETPAHFNSRPSARGDPAI